MAENDKAAPKGAAVGAKSADAQPSLYKALESLTEKALSSGDHAAYAALHPVVMALANAKFMASQAVHHVKPSREAAALLDRIKAL
jgi:hypothetical protein